MSIATSHKPVAQAARAGLLVVLGVWVNSASAVIKCWTNQDGVHECGAGVPPEYAQQALEVKNSAGLTLKTQPRAKTTEELAAARATEEIEARKRASESAARQRRTAADKALLQTFNSEEDLMLARDGQLQNLATQVKLTENHVVKLQRSLDLRISKAADFERRGKPLPPDLAQNIESEQKQIALDRNFIATKQAEQTAVKVRFEQEVARFRELRESPTH